MENTREHIIFFIAQKMFHLERIGQYEKYYHLLDYFEHIDLEKLLEHLSAYYNVDIGRELDDFYLEENELIFITRLHNYRYMYVFKNRAMQLVAIEILE